ncbi:MAG TPA: hypothetical protein PLT75_14435 [Spirochaetota bacterium]|nr:hypothetical protein [Spirochaetota bacterium]
MKVKQLRSVSIIALCVGVLILLPVIAHAQQTEQPKQATSTTTADSNYDPAKDPDSRMLRSDNYLKRFEAVETVENLMKDNLERIYLLKVIVSNFNEAGWKENYTNIYKKYRDGLQNYYKRKVITSQNILTENRKEIQDLFKKVEIKYRKDAEEMLDVCAKAVLIVSLNKLTRYDPDKNKQLMENMMRLRVAYGEMDDAYESKIDHKYMYSIFHYRVAKTYAIAIMNDLINNEMKRKDMPDPDEEKMVDELIQKKNSLDLARHHADNLNKIYSQQQQSK